jgi:hypothetical protein
MIQKYSLNGDFISESKIDIGNDSFMNFQFIRAKNEKIYALMKLRDSGWNLFEMDE